MQRRLVAAIAFAFAFTALAGCKSEKDKQDIPTHKPPRKFDAATTKPVAPPAIKKVELTIRAGQVGPLDSKSKKDRDALSALMTGYQVVEEKYQAEGDEYTTLFVKDGDKKVLNIEDHFSGKGLSVTVLDNSVRDQAGLGIGSTHAKLAATYKDLSCKRETFSEGETEGMGPIDSVVCTSATMTNVEWSFDIRALKLPGKKLPPAEKLAPLAVTGLSVALI